MATTQTTAEKRASLQRQIDELDLKRVQDLIAVFQSEGFTAALTAIESLSDPADIGALQRSVTADASSLIASTLVPFRSTPELAEQMAAQLTRKLNPPAPPVSPPMTPTPVPAS